MANQPQIIQIQNDHALREFAVGGEFAVATTRLVNLRTGKDFIAGAGGTFASREFSLLWRGETICGNGGTAESGGVVFVRSSHRSEADGRQILDMYLATPLADLEIRLTYEMYGDFPAVRKRLTATNLGRTPGRLEAVAWEDVAISPGGMGDLFIRFGVEAQCLDSFCIGTSRSAVAQILDLRSRQGYLALNEAPTPSAALEVNPGWKPRLRVLFSPAFEGIELQPEESFSTPQSSIALFDARLLETGPVTLMHDYVRGVIGAKRAIMPPVVYSTPPPVRKDGRHSWLETKLLASAGAGLSFFAIEGGGMRRSGGFTVDIDALPGGLGAAAARLRESGISLGLSVPLAALDPDCAVAQERLDWLCRDAEGRIIRTERDGQPRVMACLASGYRDYLLNELKQLCMRDGVGYLHLTGPVALPGPSRLASCHAPAHDHGTPGETNLAIIRALLSLAKDLSEAKPELILGFDHDLWGVSGELDLACLQAFDFCRVCDMPDVAGGRAPLDARRLFYRRVRLFPPECMALGSLRADGPNPVAAVATAMLGFPILAGQAESLAPGQLDWLHSILKWRYTLANRVNFNERLYLLQGFELPRPLFWDGYAKLNRNGEGFIGVFRNNSESPSHEFAIPGLDPAGTYRLESVFRDRLLAILPASEFMRGQRFELLHPDGADLVQVLRVET